MRIAMLCASVLLSLAAANALSQERRQVPEFRTYGAPGSEAAGEKINALIAEYKDAWARQDAKALVALHADDTEWINAYARMFQDAESLGVFLGERLFPEFDPSVSRQEAANMKAISIRYMNDDAAVVHLYTDGQRGPSRNAGEELRRTHLHLVLEQRDSRWKIVHTAIMDAR